ncbi:MAG: Pyridoxal phosphate biosynthetic protein [uncultured bacterium]|nr:MAG: Pyridoxal phosphate biosynthetic protein [uncultured bacterium]HLD45676.1 pyridoxine 5'-phosphate synthase [bacterium]
MTSHRRLGVNIDHIATIRQSRGVVYPDPVEALSILKSSGVDQVTIHLREDRRHIQDHDLDRILALGTLPVNLEMAVTDEMVAIACQKKPSHATLVPERREEVTTEGGLDCEGNLSKVQRAVSALQRAGIHTSLFIDPDLEQVTAAKDVGANAIEIHTGTYCNVIEEFYGHWGHYHWQEDPVYSQKVSAQLAKIRGAAQSAHDGGLKVYAGHGLHTQNLAPITAIELIEEYNIGHAIIARAVFVGLKQAIEEIQELLKIESWRLCEEL